MSASLVASDSGSIGMSVSAALLWALALVLLAGAAAAALSAWRLRRQRKSTQQQGMRRRMSNIGFTTLVTESETNLSIPVSLLSIAGVVSREAFVARLNERIATDPFFRRFRSRVVGAERSFEELEAFDAADHVRTHVLRAGETPISFTETLVNTPLDASKPLWEMHLLEDPQSAEPVTHVAWKIHHCIGDGASLASALVRLSDNKAELDDLLAQAKAKAASKPRAPRKTRAQRARDLAGFLVLCAWSAYVVVRKLLALVFRPEPATVFKRRGGKAKRLSYNMVYSVAATKAVGKRFGATINDVMLACVAGAMRRAMLAQDPAADVAPALTVRAAIPVDMRSAQEVVLQDARNKFSALVIDLPIGVVAPAARLRLVTQRMGEAKHSLEKFFTYTTSHVVAQLPEWLMRRVVQFTTSKVSVAISNVRAASFSLGFCGHTLCGFFGFVPPPPSVNLGIAILSVGDDLGLNVLVDPNVGIDAAQFLQFAKQEYDALRAEAEAPAKPEAAATEAAEKKHQ
ncbi:hypothetical protein P43SY_003277 [Pythium insidiosum]|uniref:Diacylglycerol O-acyltransferase n=1 Tax=Pythium insidiosum TaxID=114742 RepID=A0AAD5LX38_PYTIN|nr:hypothetical protein P43SY_003277 [Pythium insidiosum]